MKKRFFAEQMGRIHMTAAAMSSLAIYLQYGLPKNILAKHIEYIHMIEDDEFWQSVTAENISRKAKLLKQKIDEKLESLTKEITKLTYVATDHEVIPFWLSCIAILSPFVHDNFAQQFYQYVTSFFITNVRSFSGDDYLELLDLLADFDRDDDFEILTETLGLSPEEYTVDEILKKFSEKYQNLRKLN